MVDPTLPLPGLSPIAGKEVVARFDGGRLSSDGGLLVVREIERQLGIAERLAACIEESTAGRFKAAPAAGKVRRFKEFHDAAGSWSRVRRIIARVEAGA